MTDRVLNVDLDRLLANWRSPKNERVLHYAAAMKRGDKFPPIHVNEHTTPWRVIDGDHRVMAARLIGLSTLPGIVRRVPVSVTTPRCEGCGCSPHYLRRPTGKPLVFSGSASMPDGAMAYCKTCMVITPPQPEELARHADTDRLYSTYQYRVVRFSKLEAIQPGVPRSIKLFDSRVQAGRTLLIRFHEGDPAKPWIYG